MEGRDIEQRSQARATDGSAAGTAAARPEGPWTVRRLIGWIAGFLGERGIDAPRTIAEILLGEVLQVERLKLYMEPDRELDATELATLRALVARAAKHEPVQFLVGRWPFFGRDFTVAPCTLIPRPCTETLVERALEWYRARGGGSVRAIDLCTGTGCIAVSIALGLRAIARPSGAGCRPIRAVDPAAEPVARNDRAEGAVDARAQDAALPGTASPAADAGAGARAASEISVIATDVVAEAVELARGNARRLGASIDLRVGDLWSAARDGERFDLVVSNPPYVTDAEYAELDRNVRDYEPASALRGGRDGLDFVRRVVDGAAQRLDAGGLLLIEIGWKHGDAARALVAGPRWSDVEIIKDGEGIDRVLSARRTPHG
jgi:release factor glutamine methyltransferase